MLPQIALHIGAHKTATTHLQRSLVDQAKVVRGAGVAFFAPSHFRKGPSIAQRFGLDGDVSKALAQETLQKMANGARRVVLSEENFIGTLQNRHGRIEMPLYPSASKRIARLADQIAPDGIDVFLSIRNPATFISSAYGQALLGGYKVVLEEVKAENRVSGVNWAAFVGRVADAKGIKSLTVWRYEDYADLFPQIVDGMLGEGVAVTPLPDYVHQGLSQDAVAKILALYADGKDRKAAVRVRERLPVGPDHPAFDAFSAQEHSAAAAQYAEQVAQIAAMPKVTLLQA